MGWNSWYVLRTNINEVQIRAIADAMVSSRMRDLGYEYLVLDDGWMAGKRDSAGRLTGNPNDFRVG